MATLVQIGEGTKLAERKSPLEGTALFEDTVPQSEMHPVTTGDLHSAVHLIHILLRTLVAALIAPILLAAALVVSLFVLADFSWFRLRDLRNGHPHPKGLWEF